MSSVILAFVCLVAPLDDPPEKAKPEKHELPKVRAELAERVAKDQKLRMQLVKKIERKADGTTSVPKEFTAELLKVDAANTKWLKAQVDKHGWLGKTLVGTKGAHDAWLLVQHADQQPKFQRRCLDLMTKMPKGEVSGSDLAYLTDRVLLAEGKPQRYGTQCKMKDGKATLQKVEDRMKLNERRKSVGLPPVEQYLKFVERMYATGGRREPAKDEPKKTTKPPGKA